MKLNVNSLFGLVIVLLVVTSSAFTVQKKQVKYTKAFAVSDTLAFTGNELEGWSTLQTYLHLASDSVEFELILSRAVPENCDWGGYSLFGTISSGLAPIEDQIIEYKEPNRTWSIKVLPNGTCFIKLLNGPTPDGNPCILPLKTKYKK